MTNILKSLFSLIFSLAGIFLSIVGGIVTIVIGLVSIFLMALPFIALGGIILLFVFFLL